MTSERYLLDTCAFVYLAEGEAIAEAAAEILRGVPVNSDRICISAFSAWEIGMLVRKGRMNMTRPPLSWFEEGVAKMAASVLLVSPAILIHSSFLPAPLHADPADRILIATARERDLTIVTRDRAILAYGAAGHVKVLAC